MGEVKKMYNLSKATEALDFFGTVAEKNCESQVLSVFSYDDVLKEEENLTTYDSIFILFDNRMCVMLKYLLSDELFAEYRPISEIEYEVYKILSDEQKKSEYGAIDNISVNLVKGSRGFSDSESFDEVYLETDAGKTIVICADGAVTDGELVVQLQ